MEKASGILEEVTIENNNEVLFTIIILKSSIDDKRWFKM